MSILNRFILALFCFSICVISCSQPSSLEHLPTSHNSLSNRAIFLDYKEFNDSIYIGSGFLLLKDTSYYIVTAAHNLSKTKYETLNIYFKYDEKTFRSFPVFRISPDSSMSVRISSYYDLAVVKLYNLVPNNKTILNQIVIPFKQICIDTSLITRGASVIGYGYHDLSGNNVANIIPKEKIDSTSVSHGVMYFMRWDENKMSRFFILKDSANRGMSGGPIFIENETGKIDDTSKLVGIFHGYFLNDDHLYYSQATPFTGLDSLINSFHDKKTRR